MSVQRNIVAARCLAATLIGICCFLAGTASAQAAVTPEVKSCLDHPAAKSHEVRRTENRVEVTEYLPAGAYRISSCQPDGEFIRSVTAEPHRLPDGRVVWLPHERRLSTSEGVRAVVADFGDFRLYEGDWRAAVAEASRFVPEPASPSRVTKLELPEPIDTATMPKRRGDPNVLEIKEGDQDGPPTAQRMSDPRCGYGGYSFAYYNKTAAVHQINLAMISVEHHPAFIENINQGFNTWQYTYNICGFAPVNGVTAATTGYTLTPAGSNDGIEIVDAGPLTSGSCAGAVGCAYIWPDLKHDVRLSTAYPYCVGWCAGHYDIWSIMAHEAGHVYGFGHDSTGGMVMYTYVYTNDAGPRYLWWGDYQGLSTIY